MRPGYSVFLEWGWSQYIDNNENIQQSTSTLDIFGDNLTDTSIQKTIIKFKTTSNSNRDGMLGLIKNFSWKFRDDGGYDCKLTMISRGALVEGIPATTNTYSLRLKELSGSKDFLSYLVDSRNSGILSDKTGVKLSSGDPVSDLFASLIYLQADDRDKFEAILDTNSKKEFAKLKNTIDNEIILSESLQINMEGAKDENGKSEKISVKYISFGEFIELINKLLMLKSKEIKDNDIIKFEVEDSRAKVDYNQFAVDLQTCLIVNKSFPKYAKGNSNITGDYKKYLLFEYFVIDDQGEEYGDISSILISIQTIFDSYVNHKDNILNLVTDILNKVNDNIGGINDFATHVNPENPTIVQIMDLNYLPPQARNPKDDSLFGKKAGDFEIFNNKSILTSLEITSEIPSSMQTSIAIGAQASNAGSPNSTNNNPYNAFNLGIKDRLVPDKLTNNALDISETLRNYKNTADNLFAWFSWGPILFQKNDNLSELQSQLKDYINWVRGNTINHIESSQALIPLKLSFELEGISGIVIGERFTIPANILPSAYKNSKGIIKVGFIVTEMDHKIDTKGWKTKISGLMYMLQNEVLQDITAEGITDGHPYYNFKLMIKVMLSQGKTLAQVGAVVVDAIANWWTNGTPVDAAVHSPLTEQDLFTAYDYYKLDNENGAAVKAQAKAKEDARIRREQATKASAQRRAMAAEKFDAPSDASEK